MTDKTSLAAGTFAGARARIQDNASRGLWSSRWVFFLAACKADIKLALCTPPPHTKSRAGSGCVV